MTSNVDEKDDLKKRMQELADRDNKGEFESISSEYDDNEEDDIYSMIPSSFKYVNHEDGGFQKIKRKSGNKKFENDMKQKFDQPRQRERY